jgi:hypothetical protein
MSKQQQSILKTSLETAKSGDVDTFWTLYYVDREYNLGLLKLYNECIEGTNAVSTEFSYTPGTRDGAITVKTRASGVQTHIRSVHTSGLTLKKDGPLQKDAIVDSGGVTAEFDVDPAAEIAWILVQTEAGGAKAFLETKRKTVMPSPTASMPPSGPIRSKRVKVPATTAAWLESGVSLSEGEQARITVDPKHSEWTVNGKKPTSFRGLGFLSDDTYAVGRRAAGALVIRDGDVKTYGFDQGVDELWIRTPGRIAFVCNDIRAHSAYPNRTISGYDDNSGEVVAVIDVFLLKNDSN